jgi:hypothetical protein
LRHTDLPLILSSWRRSSLGAPIASGTTGSAGIKPGNQLGERNCMSMRLAR